MLAVRCSFLSVPLKKLSEQELLSRENAFYFAERKLSAVMMFLFFAVCPNKAVR
jgi:hypothetical protein